MSVPSKTFTVTLVSEGAMCFIPVPFDPRKVFGRVRAPVTVTLNGYSYRSTIAAMGAICVPLRRSHREAAGLAGTETLRVRLELDVAPRIVAPPGDLVDALRRVPGAWQAWTALSYSHQREHARDGDETAGLRVDSGGHRCTPGGRQPSSLNPTTPRFTEGGSRPQMYVSNPRPLPRVFANTR